MRKSAIAGVFLAVLAVLAVLTYVTFATETGHELSVLWRTVTLVALGLLLSAVFMNWGQRIGALGVVVGLVVFQFAVVGGTVGCHGAGYAGAVDYGATYDWETNTLEFGDTPDGETYRCEANPFRPGVLLGYLFVAGGTVELLRHRGSA